MATGTTQLLANKQEDYGSSSDEDVNGEPLPVVPEPVKDGLPQVSKQLHCLSLAYELACFMCLLVVLC